MAREVAPTPFDEPTGFAGATGAVGAEQVRMPLPTRRSVRQATGTTYATPGGIDVPVLGTVPATEQVVVVTEVSTAAAVDLVDLVVLSPAAPEPVAGYAPLVHGRLDAVIETDGRGFPALSPTAPLDWLASNAAVGAATTDKRQPARAWLRTVRSSVAGVDLRSAATRRVLPQVGVVAVMAVATMGNAMAGHMGPNGSSIGGASTTFARAQTAILPGADEGTPVTSDLDTAGDLVAGEDGVLRVRGAEDASRSGTRDALPGCDGVPPEVVIENGDVPDSYLCLLPNGVDQLRADAAEAFALLNATYAAETGEDICVSSGYRSFAAQANLRRLKPGLAARAGSSQHGYGLALDLCDGVEDEGGAYWWLRENAPAFGFDNPDWARRGGSKYEPWHWEYVAGQY